MNDKKMTEWSWEWGYFDVLWCTFSLKWESILHKDPWCRFLSKKKTVGNWEELWHRKEPYQKAKANKSRPKEPIKQLIYVKFNVNPNLKFCRRNILTFPTCSP